MPAAVGRRVAVAPRPAFGQRPALHRLHGGAARPPRSRFGLRLHRL